MRCDRAIGAASWTSPLAASAQQLQCGLIQEDAGRPARAARAIRLSCLRQDVLAVPSLALLLRKTMRETAADLLTDSRSSLAELSAWLDVVSSKTVRRRRSFDCRELASVWLAQG
jgi:hypothetical protein